MRITSRQRISHKVKNGEKDFQALQTAVHSGQAGK